jgi:hypothetical protein
VRREEKGGKKHIKSAKNHFQRSATKGTRKSIWDLGIVNVKHSWPDLLAVLEKSQQPHCMASASCHRGHIVSPKSH